MDASYWIILIAAFVGGFGILVFIHEMGHYLVARLFGVSVESFAVGMGPEVAGFTAKSGVRWKICAFPLGGYVKFSGDENAASTPAKGLNSLPDAEKKDLFHFKPLHQRSLIVLAGPLVNLAAGALVFAGFYMVDGIRIAPPEIGQVQDASPAAQAGLMAGDRIVEIDGSSVSRFTEIGAIVKLIPRKTVTILVERDNEPLLLPTTIGESFLEDRFGNRYSVGRLGISSPETELVYPGPIDAISEGIRSTAATVETIFKTLGQMVMGVRSVREAGGPLRIGAMMGDAATVGLPNLVLLLALISINLGVVNLLPIPMLDGGHLFFYIIEAVKGSPLPEKMQQAGYAAGAALMFTLMVLVTLNDLQSFLL